MRLYGRLPISWIAGQRQKAQLRDRLSPLSFAQMAPGTTTPAIRLLSSLREIDRASWDDCANPGWGCDHGQPRLTAPLLVGAPTIRSSRGTFWRRWSGPAASRRAPAGHPIMPCWSRTETRTAPHPRPSMPCYVKSHSQGEYVFDWGWAEAFERAGGRYYPKLQVSVPFTPVTGPRILTRPGAGEADRKRMMAAGLVEMTRRLGVSSAHLTFLHGGRRRASRRDGFLAAAPTSSSTGRTKAIANFDGFLAALASRKRKAIRKERGDRARRRHRDRMADRQRPHRGRLGLVLRLLHGHRLAQMGPALPEPPLLLAARRADGRSRVLLIMAKRDGRYIAGALNLIGSDTLYGRYWGAIEEHPCLHFEVCYYQAIDFALAHGLRRVEAGAQGAHKLARGYLPTTTHSAHYIADPNFRRAVANYLENERREVAHRAKRWPNTRPSGTIDRQRRSSEWPPTIRTTSSPKSCAANCPRQRCSRTSTCSSSWMSCRRRRVTRW